MTTSKNILITGATGMVGRALSQDLLDDGHTVHGLLRPSSSGKKLVRGVKPLYMDLMDLQKKDTERLEALGQLDAVIHLAGEPIAGLWAESKKARIYKSRVDGTRHLSELLCGLEKQPKAVITASAIGIYGEQNGDAVLDETATHGGDFLAKTCEDWEASTELLSNAGIRVAHTRFGIILAKEGGALQAMLPAFKLGIAGRLGSGDQWMSWVHLDDVVGAIKTILEHDDASGAYNVVAPQPVTNKEYTELLGDAVSRPTLLPAPAFALKMLLGEMAEALLLASQRCTPARLQDELSFTFTYPALSTALKDLI
jgi:uncharacterized protein